MARARNIKPGFFKNEELAECQPLARILFAGLWCAADREGRLEDRPKRLKAEYLPYDTCDADALLNELARRGFIVRYVVDGAAYIAIPTFGEHQNPHVKEPASRIPAPDKSGASPVQPQCKPDSGPADSLLLIPDSLQEHVTPNGVTSPISAEIGPEPAAEVEKPKRKPVPFEAIVAAYHDTLPELPRCEVLTEARKGAIRQRWTEHMPALDDWRNFFTHVRGSPFLMGRAPPQPGKPPFRADLEWLTRAGNFAKIAEGRYHR